MNRAANCRPISVSIVNYNFMVVHDTALMLSLPKATAVLILLAILGCNGRSSHEAKLPELSAKRITTDEQTPQHMTQTNHLGEQTRH